MQDELLYYIFEQKLLDLSQPEQTKDDFIHDVTAEYIYSLMLQGNIPEKYLDAIEDDTKEILQNIYLTKTYGFFNLKTYRQYFCKIQK